MDAGSRDEVVVTQLLYPTYRGALVVCQGGDQAQVKLAKQTQEASKANIATVSWSFNWKDAAEEPGAPDASAYQHNWEDDTPC